MTYKLLIHAKAVREIEKLDEQARESVKDAISGLASQPLPLGVAKLNGRTNAYRIRIGDYRILYEIHATEIVVYVFGVAHRKEVYLRLLRRR